MAKYKFQPTGVLHLGASEGQEAEMYAKCGIDRMIWVEAIPEVFEKLKANIAKYPQAIAINACLSDVDGQEVDFNISSNDGQSSSMLEFGTHSKHHPNVTFTDKRKMITFRVDTLLTPHDLSGVDLLNADLQGCELLALKGMGELLRNFKACYLEVNEEPLYVGCALVSEIDDYLQRFGFVGVETKMTSAGWGDKLYLHESLLNQ